MDELELEISSGGVNFIPCVKWVQRGVSKAQPEKVKLDPAELAGVIEQTRSQLEQVDVKVDEPDSDGADSEDDGLDVSQGSKVNECETVKIEEATPERDGAMKPVATTIDEIDQAYNLAAYDQEDSPSGILGLGDLVKHSNPREDPYLLNPDLDDDASDNDDMQVKPTDNLILVGHVEGNASILEVYVCDDVENALYVHHDILLPSFPLALEWMSFDPESDSTGSLVAVGSMNPVIEVWDLDLIDCLEPAFKLGKKGSKKKKLKSVGHKEAVLALSWNQTATHVLASGSVDTTVLLWDMSKLSVANTIRVHEEKVQTLQWHPFEAQTLLSGCCDETVRVFDCRSDNAYRSWKVKGEVEKVVWNHFQPFTFYTGTEAGNVYMIDVRQDSKPVWTLKAHSDGVNGMSLSTQCPDCLVTVSTDKTAKIWDVSNARPKCIQERNLKLGRLHCIDACPDAPFVFCAGGDKSQDNLKVFDLRESKTVLKAFGDRRLQNPLGGADFGFNTANEAEPEEAMDASADEGEWLDVGTSTASTKIHKGAMGKFKVKDLKGKKKKKKKPF